MLFQILHIHLLKSKKTHPLKIFTYLRKNKNMFNSIESVKQIIIRNTSIIQSLKDKEKYYAHTCIGRESE